MDFRDMDKKMKCLTCGDVIDICCKRSGEWRMVEGVTEVLDLMAQIMNTLNI